MPSTPTMPRLGPERFIYPPPPKRPKKFKPNPNRRNWWIERIVRRVVLSTRPRRCEKCERASALLQCHHVIPVARGGTLHPRNVILVCQPCHRRLHGKD